MKLFIYSEFYELFFLIDTLARCSRMGVCYVIPDYFSNDNVRNVPTRANMEDYTSYCIDYKC